MKHILILIFCLGVSIGGFCQAETLLVNETFDHVSIEKVFKVLKKRYGLKVAYDYQAVAAITISTHIEGETLESALGLIFSNTGLEYQLKSNRLLVRSMPSEISTTNTTSLKKKYHFKGTIIDSQTNKPLEFATVSIVGEDKGTDTDRNGQFRLSLSTSKKSGQLLVQYLGYLPQTIDWDANSDLRKIKIVLEPKPLDFEEITITDRLPTIGAEQKDGAIQMNASKLNTLPSFVGGADMFRSIQLLPGVSADDDLSAELRIRGGNGDENMVILDGITLYKVDHYFGIFSAINSSLVDQVNVYKNAFPVEYGGRTSGVVEFSTNEIERPKIGGGVEANLLTSNAYLELPLAPNMNILLGGRITNKNVADTELFSLLDQNMRTPTNNNNDNNNNNNNNSISPNTVSRNSIIAYEPDFSFYDFNIKSTWNVLPTTRLTASYFQGYDEFNYDYTQLFTVGASRRRQTRNEETYEEVGSWQNRGWSIQAQHTWAENLQSNLTTSYSGFEENQTINTSLISGELRRDPRTDNVSIIPSSIDTIYRKNNNYNEVQGLDLNFKNEWHISEQEELTFGYNFIQNEVVYDLEVDDKTILTGSPTTEQHALYAQYRVKLLDDKLQMSVGLRGTNYSSYEKNYFSPRLMLNYQATKAIRLKASWSQYNQFLRRAYYEDRFGRSNEFYAMADKDDFPISQSKNWMTGFNYRNDFFEVDVELYQKNTTGILEYALPEIGLDADRNTRIPEYELFSGNRATKGLDVLLKKTSKNYVGWIAYTLSETTNSFKEIKRGEPYPSRDDRRHQLKWVNQYRYKQFDFSATYIYSSGKPYTDLSQFTENLADRRETDILNSYLESYQRIDIGLNYRFKLGTAEGKIGVSIFNLLNRKNVKYRQFVLSVRDLENTGNGQNQPLNTVLGTELQMLDRTPNISVSLKF